MRRRLKEPDHDHIRRTQTHTKAGIQIYDVPQMPRGVEHGQVYAHAGERIHMPGLREEDKEKKEKLKDRDWMVCLIGLVACTIIGVMGGVAIGAVIVRSLM